MVVVLQAGQQRLHVQLFQCFKHNNTWHRCVI